MIVTRFAPSPTGQLHLGHAYSAVTGHRLARDSGGRFLLRIEDLDRGRSRHEFIEGIEKDLRWLGIEWDETPLVQSERSSIYAEALNQLHRKGLVYACFCTRSDIAAALIAPHGPAGAHYPGTCRNLGDDPVRRASTPHSWRLDSARAVALTGVPTWTEHDGRTCIADPADISDVILARKDAPGSYHLSCVIDDSASGVTHVVRGADLASSTPIQRILQQLLDLAEPAYLHHPLVVHAGGRRLAKRDRSPSLAAIREQGIVGPALAADLAAGKLPIGFDLGAS